MTKQDSQFSSFEGKLADVEESLMPLSVLTCVRKRLVFGIGSVFFFASGLVFGGIMVGNQADYETESAEVSQLIESTNMLKAVKSYRLGVDKKTNQPAQELML